MALAAGRACVDDDGSRSCLNVGCEVHVDPPEMVSLSACRNDDGSRSGLNVGGYVHGNPPVGLAGLADFDDFGSGSSLNVGCDAHRDHLLDDSFESTAVHRLGQLRMSNSKAAREEDCKPLKLRDASMTAELSVPFVDPLGAAFVPKTERMRCQSCRVVTEGRSWRRKRRSRPTPPYNRASRKR